MGIRIWVDEDDILDELSDDQLLDELQRRRVSVPRIVKKSTSSLYDILKEELIDKFRKLPLSTLEKIESEYFS